MIKPLQINPNNSNESIYHKAFIAIEELSNPLYRKIHLEI